MTPESFPAQNSERHSAIGALPLDQTQIAHSKFLSEFAPLEEMQATDIGGQIFSTYHLGSGTQVRIIRADAPQASVRLVYSTPASDDTGAAHIAEHIIGRYCQEFPSADAGARLMRALKLTDLNAFTESNYTSYHASTNFPSELFKAARFFLSSTFYPLIRPDDFVIEAWGFRLREKDRKIKISGIVINEMCGAQDIPEHVLTNAQAAALFADSFLKFDAGGNPGQILKLTRKKLEKKVYDWYQPNNASIVFSGKLDPIECLEQISDIFRSFKGLSPNPPLLLSEKGDVVPFVRSPYTASQSMSEPGNSILSISHRCCLRADIAKSIELEALSQILVGGVAPLLRGLLEEHDFCGVVQSTAFDEQFPILMMNFDFRSVHSESLEQIESALDQGLKEIVAAGIPPQEALIVLDSLKTQVSYQNTQGDRSADWGILLSQSLMDGASESAVFDRLRAIKAIEERVSSGEPVFENAIKQFLLDRSRRSRILLEPDPKLPKKWSQKRARFIKKKSKGIKADEIRGQEERIAKHQASQDLTVSSVDESTVSIQQLRVAPELPFVQSRDIGSCQSRYFFARTQGLVFSDIIWDLNRLSLTDLQLLPIVLGNLLPTMGSKPGLNEFAKEIDRGFAEIECRPKVFPRAGTEGYGIGCHISVYGKPAQIGNWPNLFKKILTRQPGFTAELIRDHAHTALGELISQFQEEPRELVSLRLRGRVHVVDAVRELLYGMSQVEFLRQVISEPEAFVQPIHDLLNKIAERAQFRPRAISFGASEQDALQLHDWLQAMTGAPDYRFEEGKLAPIVSVEPIDEGIALSSRVQSVGLLLPCPEIVPHGAMFAAMEYINLVHLWENVRGREGAYGSSVSYSYQSKSFVFTSKRDPSVARTINTMRGSGKFLKDSMIDSSVLNSLKRTAVNSLEPSQSPQDVVLMQINHMLKGTSDEALAVRRNELLDATAEEVKAYGAILDEALPRASMTIVGSSEALAKRSAQFNLRRINL